MRYLIFLWGDWVVPLRFVWKSMDLPDTLIERVKQRCAPAHGSEGSRLLIGLLVGLSQKFHGGVGRMHVFSDSNCEFDITSRLALLDGEVLQQAQLIGRVLFSMMPFGQVVSSP
jgi:hypothetical protein